MTDTRTETDSIGPIEVPATAYWGAQTERSIENFPFDARERMPIGIVHALARTEREVLETTLGLRAPIGVGGDLDRADRVGFGAGAHAT